MEAKEKNGNIYLAISAVLYFIYIFGIGIFIVSGNVLSRYMLTLFQDDAETYLAVTSIILLVVFITGFRLCRKAKTVLERSIVCKIMIIIYWITIIASIVSVIGFIVFFILMIMSGSLM